MKSKLIITLSLIIFLIFSISTLSLAAESDNVTLIPSSSTVKVGDTITIKFKVSQKIASADWYFRYPSNILKLDTNQIPDYCTVNSTEPGNLHIIYLTTRGIYDDNDNCIGLQKFDEFDFKFKVLAAGQAQVSTEIESLIIDTTEENTTTLPFTDTSITITAQESDNPPTDDISVTSVSLNKTTASIAVGETTTLSATVLPSNATNKTVTWSSSDTTVATVSNGTVTGVKAGTATITATAGTKSATCAVTVTAVNTPSEDDDGLTWTNFSNMEYKFKSNEKNNNNLLYLDFKDILLIDNHTYWVYFSNNTNNITEDIVSEKGSTISSIDKHSSYVETEKYELNSDIYVYILETQIDSEYNIHKKLVVQGQKIERKEQLTLGNKISAFFFSDSTNIVLWEPCSYGRKVNYKFGKVTDSNILKAIQKGENGCLSRLLEYAKSAKNGKTGTISIKEPGNYSESITSSLGIINGEYYYMYMEVEDENGKFYPIEDIMLYQGLVGDSIGINLYNYLDKNFTWNLADDGSGSSGDDTQAPTSIPQAGENYIVAGIIVAVISVATISVIKYRRYRDI